MEVPLKKKLGRFKADILGWLCIILAFFVGPIPGPGGLPLIYAGLNLLSIHNHWAARLKEYVAANGKSVLDLLFPDIRRYQVGWDVIIIGTTAFGIWLIRQDLHWILDLMIVTGFYVNVIFFLRNRRRWQRLWRYLRTNR